MSEMNVESVRLEVRTWLEENWDTNLGLVEWRNKLVDSGWGAPHWPSDWYGRDLPVGLVPIVDEEFDRIGAVGVAKMGIRKSNAMLHLKRLPLNNVVLEIFALGAFRKVDEETALIAGHLHRAPTELNK